MTEICNLYKITFSFLKRSIKILHSFLAKSLKMLGRRIHGPPPYPMATCLLICIRYMFVRVLVNKMKTKKHFSFRN